MNLLTRKVDYAILVLSHLHEQAGGACAREIAQRFGLSRAFVANILKELCAKGFVVSHRGVKGGYEIARPADDVTLVEFIDALENQPMRLAACTHSAGDDGCSLAPTCPIRGPIAAVHDRIHAVLRDVTLADLFRGREPELLTLGV